MSTLIFGGTIEGRLLAQWCVEQHLDATLCVATEYGAALAPEGAGLSVLTGRMTMAEMKQLMAERHFTRVIDATHPYAAQVTEHIRGAAGATGTPYLRLTRDGAPDGDWLRAENALGAAQLLKGTPGNILLTTGSKDLDVFAAAGLQARCWPRVLPSLESLARCLDFGFPQSHILCMQGPFSQALNEAMLRQYDINIMVTKATGNAGGFWEKAAAAQSTGCALLVIDRPTKENGLNLNEIEAMLKGERT